MYAWYESVESDLALFVRDASDIPAEITGRRTSHSTTLADVLARGRPRRRSVRAAIGHALEFETWRSLVRRQGRSRTQAVDAMARFVASV